MKKLFVVSWLALSGITPGFSAVLNQDAQNYCVPEDAVAEFERKTYTCASGYFLPANTDGCAPCPNGATCNGGTFKFDELKNQGIEHGMLITKNEPEMCASNYAYIYPVFEPIEIVCVPGTYLPADSTECVACPVGVPCNGGTFMQNRTQTQGLQSGVIISEDMSDLCSDDYATLSPVFSAAVYECSAGTYLPANAVACVQCPADSYCLGGSYTFNETTSQGATACDSGAHSPAGASSASQCVTGYNCASGTYLPKNTTACVACPDGYTCGGGTYNFDATNDQGIVANVITINWNGASQADIDANNAGTVTYGGDIRTPVRADPVQIPAGKRFVGWIFRKTNN